MTSIDRTIHTASDTMATCRYLLRKYAHLSGPLHMHEEYASPRPLSPEDKALILSLRDEGHTWNEIMEISGHSYRTVRAVLMGKK